MTITFEWMVSHGMQ